MKPYYQDERVTLYHGRWQDVVQPGQLFDHVITDAPYDEKTHKGARSNARGDERVVDFEHVQAEDVGRELIAYARRWLIVFCALEQLGDYKRGVGEGRWVRAAVWNRPDGMPQRTGDRPAQAAEGIAVAHASGEKLRWRGRGKRGMYTYGVVRGPDRVHPTQKPVGLIAELLEDFTDENETVFDPYAGSGTTGVAAKLRGRKAVLCEVREDHCDSAAARLYHTSCDLLVGLG